MVRDLRAKKMKSAQSVLSAFKKDSPFPFPLIAHIKNGVALSTHAFFEMEMPEKMIFCEKAIIFALLWAFFYIILYICTNMYACDTPFPQRRTRTLRTQESLMCAIKDIKITKY